MATPRRKPTKRTSSTTPPARKRAAAPPKKASARSAPAKKPATFDAQMQAAKQRAPRTSTTKTGIDPNSFAGVVGKLKAAFGHKPLTILDVPWEERDIVRALGAEWVETIKSYVYSGHLPEELQKYASREFSYHRWIEDQINGRIKTSPVPADGYYTLKQHQLDAVESIRAAAVAGWRGYLEADATGLGKSLAGLLGANEAAKARGFSSSKKAKLLIICPNGAIAHWENTIRHAQIDSLRVMVINYEAHKKLLTIPKSAQTAKKKKTQNKHIAEKGKPFFNWDIIIADESHKLMNITSQQTQAFERIAQYALPAKVAPFVIWMSATAGQTPLALGYLCPLIAQASRSKISMESWPEWLSENGFNVTKTGKTWKWVKPSSPNDAIARERQRQDVEKLSSILFHPKAPSIRRRPEDIAGWPPLNRIAVPIMLTNQQKDKYRKLWTEFRKEMKLAGGSRNPSGALAVQLRFAQKASLLRASQTVDNITDLLENGHQVAVSVRFLESLDAIRSGLKAKGIECSEFTGRAYIDREKEKMDFQKGRTKVMLFTVEEAVSFHAKESLPDGTKATAAPRALLVHDLRYSALSMTQIVGRTHRDGQKSNAYFLYSEGTIEQRILDIMLNKMENMTILSGDDEESNILEVLEGSLDG